MEQFSNMEFWIDDFKKNLLHSFGDRIICLGLQGSYGRGEQTSTSDIDVVVILDRVSFSDLQTYRNILDADQGSVPDNKENILRRDFSADTINQKWCTDITYIHVQKEGWTYLASVMDLCSRKIIGYAYGTSMTAELAVEAVKNACLNVKDTSGIILHSDLGSQYTSLAFEGYLAERGILHSFSRKGNPYDNACIESFHSVLKKEEIYLHTYQDFKEARRAVFEYIEGWYNRKRIHSAIGYMTPQQREDEELKKSA